MTLYITKNKDLNIYKVFYDDKNISLRYSSPYNNLYELLAELLCEIDKMKVGSYDEIKTQRD